jgi:uncharacterized protein YkwD
MASKQDKPSAEVNEIDRQIFDLVNKLRTDPKSFVPHLQEMAKRFDGFLMKQPGKTTLRTKEGQAAVQEAIQHIQSLKPLNPLKWHTELYTAARQHVNDIGPKGLVQHESSDTTSVKERLKQHGKIITCYGENLSFHAETAMEIILQ